MKKIVAICSSLLVFAGLKAQTVQPPTVKKETIKPGAVKPGTIADTAKNAAFKQVSQKDIKFDQVKKAPVVQMKETPAQFKDASSAAKTHKR